ncbi:MAG TPA: hypothetical protein GX404_06410 [Syntrophomonadaceae bacterium]|nr:hypothetical protein [Syntrophomonadaceae bacterium]
MKKVSGSMLVELLGVLAVCSLILVIVITLYTLAGKQYQGLDHHLNAQYAVRHTRDHLLKDLRQCYQYQIDSQQGRLVLWLPEEPYQDDAFSKVTYYLSGDQLVRRHVQSNGKINHVPIASHLSDLRFIQSSHAEDLIQIQIHARCGRAEAQTRLVSSKRVEAYEE